MKTGKAIMCAALALVGVTAFANVQVGTDPLDNMPLIVSDIQYAQMMNDAAERAKVTVYRLELYRYGDSETPFVVGADGVRREVVLVSPEEYEMLTGRVEKVWKQLNSTPEGRKMLHGREVSHEIDTETLRKVDIYADGFRFEQNIPPKRTRPEADSRGSQAKQRPEVKPDGISVRQWQMRKKLRTARSAKPKTVTVEHNAATGKDEVK